LRWKTSDISSSLLPIHCALFGNGETNSKIRAPTISGLAVFPAANILEAMRHRQENVILVSVDFSVVGEVLGIFEGCGRVGEDEDGASVGDVEEGR
jgi:hypothetical protein